MARPDLMPSIPVDVHLAFSPDTRGGSPAGIVFDAAGLTSEQMQQVAADVGAPATGFLTDVGDNEITVRFFSPVVEYGMCGHGTIAVLVALADSGELSVSDRTRSIHVRTGFSAGPGSIRRDPDGRVEAMLELEPAPIEEPATDLGPIFEALGSPMDRCENPVISRSDFSHLLVPMELAVVRQLQPDFGALAEACRAAAIDTVAPYATNTVDPAFSIHTRDFCPAVGTDEAAATGTTNRAVVSHVVASQPERFHHGRHVFAVEQGLEMGRPSRVDVHVHTAEGRIDSIAVGGVATFLEQRMCVL